MENAILHVLPVHCDTNDRNSFPVAWEAGCCVHCTPCVRFSMGPAEPDAAELS